MFTSSSGRQGRPLPSGHSTDRASDSRYMLAKNATRIHRLTPGAPGILLLDLLISPILFILLQNNNTINHRDPILKVR